MTNHWRDFAMPSRIRGEETHERLEQMIFVANGLTDGFAWLTPPVLNPATRLAVVTNAAQGTLTAQGFEADGAATLPFTLPVPTPRETAGATAGPRAAAPAPP